MQLFCVIAVALAGVIISWRMDRERKTRLEKMLRGYERIAADAQRVASVLDAELATVIGAIEASVRERYRHSLIEVAERVVYTKHTVKTYFDPMSNLFHTIRTPAKVLAVGVEIDPHEFRTLLKEKEKGLVLADFSRLMRQSVVSPEKSWGTKHQPEFE